MTQAANFKIVDGDTFVVPTESATLDQATLASTQQIVDEVKLNGEQGIRKYALQFSERTNDEALIITREEMEQAIDRLPREDVELLKRVADRIRTFAQAQLSSLTEIEVEVPGGVAGHTVEPISNVGCYAPAGNFALPSTVLMTCVPAKVAGSRSITLATPNPSDLMLATAAIGGADQVLAVGGAHAIAAMAYGFESLPRCDVIVGPGNRWVTAAKKIVSGDCGIDMLAGPSELVLVADETSNPETIAADLLAQAEHDTDARPFLITTSRELAEAVKIQLAEQLAVLPTSQIAEQSLKNGAAIVCQNIDEAIRICNELSPEHLELHCQDADGVAKRIVHAGCIFIGHRSAEVFGDYGVGPNHTLPTSGTARFSAGLNVFAFVRVRTYLKLTHAPESLIRDTARLAELEGLIGHQRSSLQRLK